MLYKVSGFSSNTWQFHKYIYSPTFKGASKSLSIKDILVCPLMNNAYNFNLYIKGNCSIKAIFSGSLGWSVYTGLTVERIF
jgi:hypothetical protein